MRKAVSGIGPFLRLFRPSRFVMVSLITGAASFLAGVSPGQALRMTLTAACLAIGGFSLDFYADRDLDRKGPRSLHRRNPIADHSVSKKAGLLFSVFFLFLSFILVLFISPGSVLFWAAIFLVLLGLALHAFETPFWRSLTLGLLQALYALLGASSGRITAGIALISAMFFCFMAGGRGMTDIRDYSHDKKTRVQTLVKQYGIKKTARFTALCLLVGFILSISVVLTGELHPVYLYLDIPFVILGLGFTLKFISRPAPDVAYRFTYVFMMGGGILIILAMVLGKALGP